MRISTLAVAAACLSAALISGCSSSTAGTGNGSAASTPVSTSAAATPAPSSVPSTSVAPTPSSSAPSTSSATSSAPVTTPASSVSAGAFGDFPGQWTGHSRYVTISLAGLGKESVGDGCCTPQIDLNYTLAGVVIAPSGKQLATITVTAVTVHTGYSLSQPAPKVGDKGVLTLDSGVLTDSLTQSIYCDPAEEAKGTCGA
jgi:hypothetical protein